MTATYMHCSLVLIIFVGVGFISIQGGILQDGMSLYTNLPYGTLPPPPQPTTPTTPTLPPPLPQPPLTTAASRRTVSVTNTTSATPTNKGGHRRRHKRFDYEDTYEWEDDEDLTYDSYYEEDETAELNLFQKVALHWRTVGPRLVCFSALVIMILLIYCACCRLACRFWCKSMQENCACCFLPGVKQTCQMCYTDPMYERVKELGEVMGVHISFNTYEKIKDQYVDTGDELTAMPLLM